MSAQQEITQRDLRNKSREIMDAVEGGQAFTVTRDGRDRRELIPIRRRRRFIPRRTSPPRRATPRLLTSRRSALIRRLLPTTRRASPMAAESYESGLLDTNILILRKWIDPGELPAAVAISAITLAEFSAGPMKSGPVASRRTTRSTRSGPAARYPAAGRERVDPIPFGVEAARAYGQARPQSSPQDASPGAAPWT